MPEIEPEDDGTMDPDQQARAASLTEAELRTIDECILSNITHHWRKTAKAVALTMGDIGDNSGCRTSSIPAESSISRQPA